MSNATCRGCDAVALDPETPHGGAWCSIRCYWRQKDIRKAELRTPETHRACVTCGEVFEVPPPGQRTPGALPKFCPEHRSGTREYASRYARERYANGKRSPKRPKPPAPTGEKPCGHCGATFIGATRRVYCSPACAKAVKFTKLAALNAERAQQRDAARAAMPPPMPRCPVATLNVGALTCVLCGSFEAFVGSVGNRKLCRACKAAGKYPPRPKPPKLPVAPCPECGRDFQPAIATQKFCATPCAKRNRRRRRKQAGRASVRSDRVEQIDRVKVGDRDGWKCGICAKRVDRTLKYPHPKSQSLDHIIPLSLGGTHEMPNVQIAHLDCNVNKGNRPANEQLRLVG